MSCKTVVAWVAHVCLMLRAIPQMYGKCDLMDIVCLRAPHKRLKEQLSKLNAVF